jgi:hypothetical protein
MPRTSALLGGYWDSSCSSVVIVLEGAMVAIAVAKGALWVIVVVVL